MFIFAAVIAAVMVLFYAGSERPLTQDNLLQDDRWVKISWQPHGEAVLDEQVRYGDSGPSVRIHAETENDISFAQAVPVIKGRYYRFSSWVNTAGIEGQVGANLSVLGGFSRSKVTLQGDTPWTFVEQVFYADKDEEVQFALRLGFYGAATKGAAWFASPRLEELASWRGDAVVIESRSAAGSEAAQSPAAEVKKSTVPLRLFMVLLVVPFVLIVAYLIRHGRLDHPPLRAPVAALAPLWRLPGFWLLIGAALCVRLAMIQYPGFTVDTALYIRWALDLAEPGRFLDIYPANPKDYFIDYPPLYLYVLGVVGWIGRAFSLADTPLMVAVLKLPPILMDLAVSALMLAYLRHRFGGILPWLLAGLFAFNPTVIFDSAFWGQTDVVYCAMVLVSLLLMERQRMVPAGMLLAAAFAMKPQALVFIIFYIVFVFRYYPLRTVAVSGLASVATFVAVILPFAYNRPLLWIVDLYRNTAEGYSFLSVNAFNFWGMLGLNWGRSDTVGLFGLDLGVWAVIVPVAALAAVIGVLLIGPRRDGIIPGEYGGKAAGSRWQPESLFPAFFLLAFAFFVFFPRMHERYLFPVLLFMLPLLPMARRMQWIYLATGILLLANMAYIFVYYIYMNAIPPADGWVIRSISAGIVLLFALSLVYEAQLRSMRVARLIAALGAQAGRLKAWLFRPGIVRLKPAVAPPPGAPFAMRRLDYLAVTGMSLFALGLLLFRLGDLNYPVHAYAIPAKPVQLELRFDPPAPIAQVDIYDGVLDGRLVAQYQASGGWQPLFKAEKPEVELTEFYKVLEKKVDDPAPIERVRLELSGENAEILELGFFGVQGQLLNPSQLIVRDQYGERPMAPREHALFDEPETLRLGGGYMRSTYFDEIYHGRTALEFIRDIMPYENTHPPLGKILIGLGIRAFDMTPFGWRVMGAVFGASMVWLLFFGGRLLTGRRLGAYLAAALILFEFINFSISRYSTIDMFLVFFITAGYLSLYKWYSLGGGRAVAGSAPWLVVAGACIGAAIATKWTGLYAGFAVFVFFLWLTVREWGTAAGLAWGGHCSNHRQFWREHVLRLGGILSVGFVLVPLLIYWLSYSEFLESIPGSGSLFSARGIGQILGFQHDMLDYHAKQSSEGHPFAAPYYSWPLILKPMWLYHDPNLEPLMHSRITLLGNPAIWWTGLAIMLVLLWRTTGRITREAQFLVGAFLALYIPWVCVERMTFIYHYFPCVPFLILGISLLAARLDTTRWQGKALIGGYVALVIGLFILLYPAISGYPISAEAAERMHWFANWNFL
ncbi:MAG: phospholipid carrier-dependent glycosyltransferase [Pseudomonadota bacterium]